MAGAAPTPSGKGGRKPLDASINLVPFIDLLSCCITFLIMTAVWTQMVAMEVQQPQINTTHQEPREKPPTSVVLNLEVERNGLTWVEVEGDAPPKATPIPQKNGSYDFAKLAEEAKALRKRHPTAKKLILWFDRTLPYKTIIAVMEQLPLYKENTNKPEDKNGFRIQVEELPSATQPTTGGTQ